MGNGAARVPGAIVFQGNSAALGEIDIEEVDRRFIPTGGLTSSDMSSPFTSRSTSTAPSDWPGKVVSLDDFTAESFDDVEEDRSPHWVLVRLADAEGHGHWVHCQAENHPAGFDVQAAGPPSNDLSTLRLIPGGAGGRLGRSGTASSAALVASAAPEEAIRRTRGKAKPEPNPEPLLPESAVNQRMRVVDAKLFMSMVRNGELRYRHEGQLYIARWGDYQAAFERRLALRERAPKQGDSLDEIRQELGYAPKHGRP